MSIHSFRFPVSIFLTYMSVSSQLENMAIQKLVGRIEQGYCWTVPVGNQTFCAIINTYCCCPVHIQIDRTVNRSSKAQPCIRYMSKNLLKRTLAVLKCLKHFSRQQGELQLVTSDLLFLFTVCTVVPCKAVVSPSLCWTLHNFINKRQYLS